MTPKELNWDFVKGEMAKSVCNVRDRKLQGSNACEISRPKHITQQSANNSRGFNLRGSEGRRCRTCTFANGQQK